MISVDGSSGQFWNTSVSDSHPALGALISPKGKVNFVSSVLHVYIHLQVDSYVETQLKEVYILTEHILQLIKIGGIYLSAPQKAAVEALIKSISYAFGDVLDFLPEKFVRTHLNFVSVDQLESEWRQLCFDAINRINIGNRERHVVGPIPRSEISVDTTTSSNMEPKSKIQNDQAWGNYTSVTPVHPKFRRFRRGLVDVGGSILSAVFGVSTEKELSEVKSEFEQNIGNVVKSTKLIQIQTKQAEARMTDALSHIKSATESLMSVQVRENRLETFTQMSIILEHLETVVIHLNDLIRETSTHRTLLQRGYVPQLISASQLRTLIEEGKDIFRSHDFPLDLDWLNNRNISSYLNLLHAEPTTNTSTFHIFIPFVNSQADYSLFQLTKFPFLAKTIDGGNNNTVLEVGVSLPAYMALGKGDHVEIDNIDKCTQIGNSNAILCALKRPVIANHVRSYAISILLNNNQEALNACRYQQLKLDSGYFVEYISGRWYLLFSKAQVATISCPRASKYTSKQLKHYMGTLVIKPPCTLTTPSFSLPTIETKQVFLKQSPVTILPIQDVVFNISNHTFPENDMIAVQNDIDFQHNITQQQDIYIDDIRDMGVLGNYNFFHGLNSTVVIVVIGLLVGIIYVARKRPELFHRCCPFLFLSHRNSYSPTAHITSSRRPEEVGEEVPEPIAQDPEPISGVLQPMIISEPMPGTSGTSASTSGRVEASQYARSPVPESPPGSPYYKRLRSPTTPPRKPSRVKVMFPNQPTPVRFVGEQEAIYEPTERETEDSAGYLLPSQRLRLREGDVQHTSSF